MSRLIHRRLLRVTSNQNKSEYLSLKKKIFKDEYEVFGEEIQEKDNDLSREEKKIMEKLARLLG